MYLSGSFLIMLSSWSTIFFSISVSSAVMAGSATISPTMSLATAAVSSMVMLWYAVISLPVKALSSPPAPSISSAIW